MKNTNVDPRIIRTRKLLVDAFIRLTLKKDFKDITIKDITDEATVNRATFYAHFQDKYDLVDIVITENVIADVMKNLNDYHQLNQDTVVQIFTTLTRFHTDQRAHFDTQCKRSYESFNSIIEQKIKKELEKTLYSLLLKRDATHLESESLKIGAAVLSWGIYGASVDWLLNSSLSEKHYIEKALPFLIAGENIVGYTSAPQKLELKL